MAEQRSTLIIEISSEQARRNAQALDRELRSIQNSGNYATTSMNSMSVACRQLAGYMMGIVTVGTAISKMDEFTNLNNRLRLVTDTQKELTLAMKDTFDIAQRSGAAWGGTAAIYQKIQYNSEKLGLSQIQVAKVTESISKSISNSSSSAQAASAALYQLGQAFDKSSLNGDEFVSMSENAGYLMEVFSKGLGVTRAELKEMSSDGQLTTDKMIQAIQKMSGSIEEDFGKTNFTIGQGFTQLSNAVTKFVGEAGQATGAATAISGSLGTLAENLNAVTNIAMIGGAYWLGSYIPAMYASVVAGYAKAKQLVEQTAIQYAVVQAERVAAAQELAGAEAKLVNLQATRAQLVEELKLELARKKKQISDQGAINSEMRMGFLRQQQAMINAELTATENALAAARTRSTAAAAASMGVGRGLLGIMTGPVGLGVAVAGVAASMLLMRDNTNTATSALDLQKQSVDELAEAYSKMSMAKLIAEMDALKNKAQEAKNEANNALNSAYAVAPNVGNFGTEKQREQNKLLSDTIKELKTGSLDAAKALQELQKGGFTQDQLDKAQRYFATFEEQNNVLKTYNYQSVLTSSYLETASGLYDKTSDKISELTKSLSRLNETYEVSYAQILKGAEVFLQVAENSGKSKDQIDAGTVALQKYSDGKITATQLSQEFLKYNLIPENQIDAFKKQVAQSDGYKKSVTGLNVELKKQNELRNEFQKQHQSVIAMKKAETQETNKQIEAQTKLNQKQQDALNGIKGDIAREAYIIANMKAGFSRDKSEFYADYRSKAELGYTGKPISSEESATVAAGYKLKQQTEARLASEKAIEASQKKQTKEAEKKYEYAQAEVKLLSKAYGDVSQSGLGAYAESRGIPANVIAGLYMQESKAGTDLTSHTGAKGPWQTTADYREQNNISMADNNDFLKVGKIVVDNIAKVFAETGNLRQAVLSHNAGETGAKNFMKDGRVKGSDVRNKEVAGYLPSIDKWASWAKGSKGELLGESDSGKDYQDFLDAQLKKKEAVKQLQAQFDTEAIQRSKDRDEQINQATILGQMDLIPKIKERYNQQELLSAFQLEMDLNGYKWGEDQKIEYRRDISKLELEISGKYGKAETELRKRGLDALAQYEIEQHELKQAKELLEIQKTWMSASVYASQYYDLVRSEILATENYSSEMKDALMKQAGMQQGMNQNEERENTWGDYKSMMGMNESPYQQDIDLLAKARAQMLITEDEYQQQRLAMQMSYGARYGADFAGALAGLVDSSSSTYKSLFYAQKMFNLSQAGMNVYKAASDAYANEPGTWYQKAGAAALATLESGAFVSLLQSSNLSGMAHDGIDNIPKEGTWLLDGGERVLNPQQNKDLTNYLSKKGSGGGNVEVNVQVTDSGVTSQSNQADQKQLGQMIGNAVRAVIMQEKRQGGLLSK